MARKRDGGEIADLIKRAFMELYASRKLREISVKEICAKVGIARTTFYCYYFDVYDLLEHIEDGLIGDLSSLNKDPGIINLGDISKEEFHYYDATLDYIWAHRDWFRILLKNQEGQFIFKWKQLIKEDFREKFHVGHVYFQSEELTLEVIASAAIGIYSYWVNTKEVIAKETISQEVIYKCFRALLS